MLNKLFLCKVCGYNYGDYVWGEDGKNPSFEICPCCGTEFGYEDATEKAILLSRKKWFDSGAKWHFSEEKPKNWNLEEQLKNIYVKGYACPCCGYLTRGQEDHSSYEICPVCFWEDDPAQFNDPNYEGGANDMSLNQARKNYKSFGAIDKRFLKDIRKPMPNEAP